MKITVHLGRPPRGFTLIELLVVAAILGIVTAAIAACLSGGIRAWDAARTFGEGEAEALLGLRILEKDIANSFAFYAVPFSGQPRGLSFPALLETVAGEDDPVPGKATAATRIGTVSYVFDRRRNALMRQQWTFPGPTPLGTGGESVVPDLFDAQFTYYSRPGHAGGGSWQESWNDSTNLPAAVRIAISFVGDDPPPPMDRTFFIPVAVRQDDGEDDDD